MGELLVLLYAKILYSYGVSKQPITSNEIENSSNEY